MDYSQTISATLTNEPLPKPFNSPVEPIMSNNFTNRPLPAAIQRRVRELRRQVVRFVWVSGSGRFLTTGCVLFLIDALIDRTFRLDLAQRSIMLGLMGMLMGSVLFYRLWRPLQRRMSDDALLLRLEDQNEALQESLISSAQFSRIREELSNSGLSTAMVDATIQRGTRMAESIDGPADNQ